MVWVYVTGAFLAFLTAGTIWVRVRTRRIAASRAGEDFSNFVASFAPMEAPSREMRAVYAKFQQWCSDAVLAFPVRADDDIARIYGMVGEDLDDAILEVLAECERVLPEQEQLNRMGPVVTVRDFLRFVAACPIRSNVSQRMRV